MEVLVSVLPKMGLLSCISANIADKLRGVLRTLT